MLLGSIGVSRSLPMLCVALIAMSTAPALAQPTTRPNPDGRHPRLMMMVQRIRQAVAQLDLTDDQKSQVKEIFDQAGGEVRDFARSLQGIPRSQRMQKAQAFLKQLRQDIRQKLQGVLTPDQMQKLREKLEQWRQEHGGAASRPSGASGAVAPANAPPSPEDSAEGKIASALPPAVEAGAAAPDVKISELNGRVFLPANYRGHVLVLEFGSMSCPVFRDRVEAMEKLKSAEGARAFFMIVYTREAFPAGDKNADRNKEQNISIPQALTLEDRKAQARQTAQSLAITIAMSVDSMDDAVSNAFGTFPNGAVVIGKDGKIAALQRWTNPQSLGRAIDRAYDAPDHPNN